MDCPSEPPIPRTSLQWWAVRLGSVMGAAFLLILLAMAITGAIESRTLAERTIQSPNGYKINFRIHREHEDIQVTVKQMKRGSGTGWSKMLRLGDTKSLGGANAGIDLD